MEGLKPKLFLPKIECEDFLLTKWLYSLNDYFSDLGAIQLDRFIMI